ncbi:MAG: hypothetical protein WA369_03265, partial [Candidatus Acidiferrales bacterium]
PTGTAGLKAAATKTKDKSTKKWQGLRRESWRTLLPLHLPPKTYTCELQIRNCEPRSANS